jgi:predicted nucleic acid-binding protein
VTFDDLPAGATVFIDANCLVYAATADQTYGAVCQRLLEEVEKKNLQACTSAHVLADLSHRLMTIEAALRFGRPMQGIANWLRRHPAEVQSLSQYRQSLDDLLAIPLPLHPITGPQVTRAADFSRQHGLLTSDAVIVAVMRDHGLTHLASNDTDFDRVPGISRYAPI